MTMVEEFANFAVETSYDELSDPMRTQIKTLVLDTLGCAIGSLDAEPVGLLRAHNDEMGGAELCTLIGGGKSTLDAAAFYNTSLIRYLDFNDGYMGTNATCHPSDNLGAVLAAAEYGNADGKTLMTALALAYEMQCRICDAAKFEANGFDQFTAGVYGTATGAARALGLDAEKTAHAVAIAGVRQNPLFVTRVGQISHWKGFAFAGGAQAALHSVMLARRGVTGPLRLFEGPSGMFDAVTGPFELDWADRKLEKMLSASVKRYNAGLHAQTAIEGALELKREHGLDPAEIAEIEVALYERAHFIMGGGEAGAREHVRDKETADHSLPYVVSAALLDDQLMPAQYKQERILKDDVQALLRKVVTREDKNLTARYPAEAGTGVKIALADGRSFETEKVAWQGHYSTPMSWEGISEKFTQLTEPHIDGALRDEIIAAVGELESVGVGDVVALLARAGSD